MHQRQSISGPGPMQQAPAGSDFGPGRPQQHQRAQSLGPQGALAAGRDDRGNQPLSPQPMSPVGSASALAAYPTSPTPEWRQQFESIFELFTYQPLKTYVASPPELEMIFARTSANQVPKQGIPGSPGNDWDTVWLQLSGTSLCEWSGLAYRFVLIVPSHVVDEGNPRCRGQGHEGAADVLQYH